MADLAVDVDRVADAIRMAHTETVAPLFRSETLAVSEKEAGELSEELLQKGANADTK